MSAEAVAESIPPGYKQTEVGVIPKDWNIVSMGSLGKFSKGQGISKDEAASGELPCVRYGEIYTHHNDVIRFFNSQISEEVARRSKRLNKGDILFAGSGETKEEIGKCIAFVGEEEAYAGGDIVILTPNRGSSKFFAYLFNSPIIAHQKASKGQGDAIVHISSSALSSIRVPFPPTLAEQEAIATALSDTDALIESLEQLIAKKRQIKQGAMQELLTGKRRLPGFEVNKGYRQTEVGVIPEDWEVKRLEELADILSGGTPSTTQPLFWDGNLLWCTPTDITALKGRKYLRETNRKITVQGLQSSSAEMIPSNSLIMTSRATIGECAINLIPVCTNQGFKNFVPFEDIEVEFLYYLLQTKKQHLISLCGGSTFLEIGKTQLANFKVQLPPTLAEQTAIATILSDMDSEITALEEKLAKTRQIKQGMMQELLTGRIRLV